MDWLNNITIWASIGAWFIAQLYKLLRKLITTGQFDLSYMFRTGGMPSAHSALTCALATSVGIQAGTGSPVFACALVMAFIVMFDAQGVRRAAGQQARLLNQIVQEYFKEHKFSQQKLVELLGHTRLEVFWGMVTGILTALAVHALTGHFIR